MNTADQIYEQVKALPEPLAREVLDFVGYLAMKIQREKVADLMLAQQRSLEDVWNNAEDDAWNHV
jgi:ADP-dependent phosphofructokinase/glucokinase